MKNKPGHCKVCGHGEFCTVPNWYDLYRADEHGKVSFVRSEPANGEFHLYCRECGEIHEEPTV